MDDPKKHKFKIEAIALEPTMHGKDPKEIFDYYEKNQVKVQGQFIKLSSVFINSLKGNEPLNFGFEET